MTGGRGKGDRSDSVVAVGGGGVKRCGGRW